MPIIDSPDFGHAFVPIDSLTGSPRSSTGSTSVLEWNSNSGSEGFSVRSLDHEQVQSSPPSPDIPILSPNPSSPKTSLSDHDQIFASFNSAAPVTDSAPATVTSDTSVDEYHNLLSVLGERLTLQDSVTQWQKHFRPDTPSDIELLHDAVQDKSHNNSASSPNRSVATESSISAVTAKPSVHVSSLFLASETPTPPSPPTPHLYSVSPSVVSNHSQSEGISIAQYFQLKAAKETEPVQPPPDEPLRPISAASCLSYASSAQSPVAVPLPDRSVEAPLLHQTWHDLVSKDDNNSTPFPPPPRCSSISSSIHPSWYQPAYFPNFSPPTVQGCSFPDFSSPPSRKSQVENHNSQINPFVPLSQTTDTLESSSKSHTPSRPAWPIPPAVSCQFEPATLKPIKPIIPNSSCLTNMNNRRPTYSYGSVHGKVSGKSTNRPVPPASQGLGSPENVNWRVSHPTPYIMHIPPSPESADSVLPSTPSVSSPTRPGSPRSPISVSAAPPGVPVANLQPPYMRQATPSNVPYPNFASPLNGEYTSTQRAPRALPIPTFSRTSGLHNQTPYTPRYTGSTLPRDMHLGAAPPTPWGPTPRRLRFAPLPPTPSAGLPFTSAPSCTQPYTAPSYTTPLPPYPLYPMSYPYYAHPPAPQIPAPISAPYHTSWRSGPTTNSSPLWTPHPVFWYSDGSIVFRVCHSFILF